MIHSQPPYSNTPWQPQQNRGSNMKNGVFQATTPATQTQVQQPIVESVVTAAGIQVKIKYGFEPQEVQIADRLFAKLKADYFSSKTFENTLVEITQNCTVAEKIQFEQMSESNKHDYSANLFSQFLSQKLSAFDTEIKDALKKIIPGNIDFNGECEFVSKIVRLSVEKKYTQRAIKKIIAFLNSQS